MKGTTIAIILAVIIIIAAAVYYVGQEPQSPTLSGESPTTSGEVSELTPDEQAALNFPSADASEEEINEHFEAVNRAAKTAEVLDVTNCVLDPVVFRTDAGSDIVVYNGGSSVPVIEVGGETYEVPARSEITITADFEPGGGGLYGYTCNAAGSLSGLPGSATGIFVLIAE